MKQFIRITLVIFLMVATGCSNQIAEQKANELATWAMNQIVITDYDIHLVESHPDYDATFVWSTDQVNRIDLENKKLIADNDDATITITVTVTYQEQVVSKSKSIFIPKIDVVALGNTALQIAQWAIDNIVSTTSVMELPHTHPDYEANIVWQINHETLSINNNQILINGEEYEFSLVVRVTYQNIERELTKNFSLAEYDISSVEKKFVNQFFDIINRNYNVKTSFNDFGGTNITWYSSNTDIFSNEGIYKAPFYNEVITIYYTITTTSPSIVRSYQTNFTVLRMLQSERIAFVKESISELLDNNIVVGPDQTLPTSIPEYDISLSWMDQYDYVISKLSEINSYIIPNVGIILNVKVTTEEGEFVMKYTLQTQESNDLFVMRDVKSIDLVKEIKVGWNIGNTLDAPSETAWGNPMITKALLDKVKGAGFNIIRIPVTWEGKFSTTGDYIIDEAYLNRVQEVVNYAIDDETFVILNMHHERWNSTTYANLPQASIIMEKLWQQIGARFANYSEKLIFEGMNEPRNYNGSASVQWTGTQESFDVINALNQVFVNTIRSLGGNHQYRHLMITTNGAGTSDLILSKLIVPNDPYVIVSVHSYAPYDFAHDKTTVTTWSITNGSQTSVISSVFNRLNQYFISKNIAVIMGEFASRDKQNLSSRLAWLDYYLNQAEIYGIPCVWWDTGQAQSVDNMTFSILNRHTLRWIFPEIVERLTR